MTPMIDMVFLLLVFFMTVSTIAKSGFQVELDLAESTESDVPDDTSNRGMVSVDAEGEIYLGSNPVTIEALKSGIKADLAINPDLQVQVRADAQTQYADVKKLLKACAEVGAVEVIYATYQQR